MIQTLFVPAIIEEAVDIVSAVPGPGLEAPQPIDQAHRSCIWDGLIEVDLNGARVRIGRDAKTEIVVAVLRALRAAL